MDRRRLVNFGPDAYINTNCKPDGPRESGARFISDKLNQGTGADVQTKREESLSIRSIRRFAPLLASTLQRDRTSYTADVDGDGKARAVIASYNIHKGVGRDRRFDPRRTAQVIREIQPDVIALQEADRRFGDRAGILDIDSLTRECGLVPVPLKFSPGGHGWHGNVILYREGSVTATRQIKLAGLEPRGALVVDLDLPTGPLRIVAAHLGLLRRSRVLQISALLSVARSRDNRPVLLMGDFNEWRLGDRSTLHGLAPEFGPLHDPIASFPARFPVLALDRILAYPQSLISSVTLHDTALARLASDHLPLKAVVDLSARGTDSAAKAGERAAA
jgi:endonuclease/exonuclease/phosphatase family metal-dependent hydrolase